MRDRPYGVGDDTRNERLLQALDLALQERQVRSDERYAFRAGFIEGWRARAVDEPGTVTITREHLRELERRAGES